MVQLHFSLLDLELHARYTPGGDRSVFDVDQVRPPQESVECSVQDQCQHEQGLLCWLRLAGVDRLQMM